MKRVTYEEFLKRGLKLSDLESYEKFLEKGRQLIKEGALQNRAQVFCFLLSYVANSLAQENREMDAPIYSDPYRYKASWDDHYGGKVYEDPEQAYSEPEEIDVE